MKSTSEIGFVKPCEQTQEQTEGEQSVGSVEVDRVPAFRGEADLQDEGLSLDSLPLAWAA